MQSFIDFLPAMDMQMLLISRTFVQLRRFLVFWFLFLFFLFCPSHICSSGRVLSHRLICAQRERRHLVVCLSRSLSLHDITDTTPSTCPIPLRSRCAVFEIPADTPQHFAEKAISSSSFPPADFLPVDIIAPPPHSLFFLKKRITSRA